ncbi:MAG: hypothetical protein AAFU79_14615 [Myxococcota bacterium]
MNEQELVALTLVGFAAVFLIRKLTGGGHPEPKGPAVVTSSRLSRGLQAAERSGRDRPHARDESAGRN